MSDFHRQPRLRIRSPDPQDLAPEAITELEAIVGDLREIVALIEQAEGVEV
ncbi:MAG: hypothetical protein ABL888_00790 [Pirellulaceae bacterium]